MFYLNGGSKKHIFHPNSINKKYTEGQMKSFDCSTSYRVKTAHSVTKTKLIEQMSGYATAWQILKKEHDFKLLVSCPVSLQNFSDFSARVLEERKSSSPSI